MVTYICNRCGYVNKHKGNFKNHLNRKNICKPTLDDISIEEVKFYYGFEIKENYSTKIHQNPPKSTKTHQIDIHQNPPKYTKMVKKIHQNPPKSTKNYACKYCNRIFSRSDSLNRHYTRCKGKKEAETLVISQNEEMIKMKKEIEELKNFKIQTQNNTTNNTSNNNSHNNTNMSKNIIINNYGDENIKHLKYKDYVDILSSKYMCVPNLIEKIHFDSEHPENQNIKYTNKKEPYLKIMKNNKWQFVNKKNELLNLIDDKCFILKEKYYKILEKKKYNITENQREKIEEFMEKYKEDDKQVMLDLIQRTELMLLNNN